MNTKEFIYKHVGVCEFEEFKKDPYFLIDLYACNSITEMWEVLLYYRNRKPFENVFYHDTDLGYGSLPREFKILKIYDEDEINFSYKRKWIEAKINWNGIILDCLISWHLHDEIWISNRIGEY
jgi:hypothetical protein